MRVLALVGILVFSLFEVWDATQSTESIKDRGGWMSEDSWPPPPSTY